MRKLRILVDMDQVLNNLLNRWVEYLNGRYGADASVRDIKKWDLSCVYPGLTKEEVDRPIGEDAFWEGLSTMPHSVETIRRMVGDGHEVYVVTAASVYRTIPAKIDWLLANYPSLSWEDVVIANKKQIVTGDVLIDDAVHNLEGGDYFKILIDSPNNAGYDAEGNGMARAPDLKAAYEIIKKEFARRLAE